MTQYSSIKLFEEKKSRTSWDAESETWYYSIVDVVGILISQPDTRHASNYWKVLKSRLSKEGCEVVTNCNQLKMQAEDGKMRLTDVVDAELLLPSFNPFRLRKPNLSNNGWRRPDGSVWRNWKTGTASLGRTEYQEQST